MSMNNQSDEAYVRETRVNDFLRFLMFFFKLIYPDNKYIFCSTVWC